MATYYVGSGGDNGNNGTTWALRKLTLNGAEDIPVSAGDTVYVGPGTYRELLTCDASGSAGSPISYIGDYTGANTDGVGGVVRITGSDNDQTATRARIIDISARNYRTFDNFILDMPTTDFVLMSTGTNITLKRLYLGGFPLSGYGLRYSYGGAPTGTNHLYENLYINASAQSPAISFFTTTTGDTAIASTIQNCIIAGSNNYRAINIERVGGITIKNCLFLDCYTGVRLATNPTAGQSITANNCIFLNGTFGVYADSGTQLVEDYNTFWGVQVPRTNVSTGANSLAYPPLFDARWFFELVNNTAGPNSPTQVISPFDLASYSQLIDVAGTSPTTTDMRGTSAINSVREWGALEYDSTLKTEGAVVNPPGWL